MRVGQPAVMGQLLAGVALGPSVLGAAFPDLQHGLFPSAPEQKAMIEALQKGDEVVAAGGVLGRITKLGEQYVTLEIAPNTEIVVQRAAVQVPLPKGTIKTLQ